MLSRQTKQKEMLEKELDKITSFFTTEELHKKVLRSDKNIGIATIYRFLKDQKKKGQLHSYTCDRKIIYSKEKSSHCHFTCEKCGKTEHVNIEKIDFLKNLKVCHFQLDITGICENCQKN